MNRVLVTGGAGTIGAAVVRRLLRDPDWEVRVSDQRAAPDCLVVDPWNAFGAAQVFAYASEVAALSAR